VVDDLLRRGVGHHQAGRLGEAEGCYRDVLEASPGHPDALHYLGLIEFQRGNFAAAVELIEAAAQKQPQVPEFHVNLGNALKRCERVEEAVAAYREALRLRPDFAEAAANLGLLLAHLQRGGEALGFLQNAVAGRPNLLEARLCLARLLDQQGAVEAALKHYALAVQQCPVGPDLLLEAAGCHLKHRRHRAAVELYRRVLDLDPGSFAAWNDLGAACADLGLLAESIGALRRALALQPTDPHALGNLANVLKDSARHEEAIAVYRQALALAPHDLSLRSNYLYALLYSDKVPAAALLAEHKKYGTASAGDQASQSARPLAPARDRLPGRPLRIAYVSGDFRNHPVAFFIEGILRAHDPARVAVFAYHTASTRDAITGVLESLVPNWRDVAGLSVDEFAAQIAADEIDVLIDLAGHTGDNSQGLFARRAAPVQMNYLGYPFSTGSSAMDFRLVDDETDPPGADCFASERLIRLPRSYYAYTPPSDAPSVAPLPALKRGYLTFGVCSNLAKVSGLALDRWAELLRSVPRARLFWRTSAFADAKTRASLLSELSRRKVSPGRVELVPWATHDQRWKAFAGIDIALDTFPYNQATNTCEALWMGVPTLTITGETHHARMGASILRAAGLPDFVCGDVRSWIEQAVYWTSHAPELAILRAGLRDQLAGSALFDVPGLTRSIEDAFEKAWLMRDT
jgi:protein O-GlcNAc transferase